MPQPKDPTAERMLDQGRALRGLARSILAGTEEADDVVHEAYVRALENPPPGGAHAGWLATVVRNLARRRLRDHRRHRQHQQQLASQSADHAPPADDVAADVQMHRDLADAVLGLAEPYRTALVLRFWHDLPSRKIARRTGHPVATVKTHLQRGLAMLRARLDQCYGDRRAWLLALVPIARPASLGALAGGTAAATSALVLTMNAKNLLLAAGLLVGALALVWTSTADGGGAPAPPPPNPPTIAKMTADAPEVEIDPEPEPAPSEAEARRAVTADAPRCEVVGRIVDDVSGAPLASATLRLANVVPFELYPDRETQTDRDGRFKLDAPWPRRGWIPYGYALASHPERATRELRLEHTVQKAIEDGHLDLGTIRLVRGVAVTGRVWQRDGQPLGTRARLLLWNPERRGSFVAMFEGRSVGFTDAAGRFALAERVTPAASGVLMLAAVTERGIGWAKLGVAPGQELLGPVSIALQPNGGLRVSVHDTDGEPIAGAKVTATPHYLPIGLAPMWQAQWARWVPPIAELEALLVRHTDKDGIATLPALPLPVGQRVRDANRDQGVARNYVVAAEADGYVSHAEGEARPRPDGIADFELTLQRERTVVVQGTVRRPDGEPVAGITVRGNGTEIEASTDEQGRYALPPYAYQGGGYFIVEDEEHPRVFTHVEIPSEGDTVDHDIVVERRAPVAGQVVDQHGAPVAGVQLMLGTERGSHYPATPEHTGADGRFAFPDAVASHDDLWITPPEPAAAWRRLDPHSLQRRDGELVVLHRFDGGLLDLRVRVVDGATGADLAPSTAMLVPLRGGMTDWSQPQPRPELALGSVTAERIRAGRYRLTVRTTDERCAERVLDLDSTEPLHDLVLELWAPASVVCEVDWSGLTEAQRTEHDGFLVLLEPRHEDSFAVDERGEPLRMTKNTGSVRLGQRETFRLQRVTPGVPRRLHVASTNLFAEAWFTAPPGEEAHVVLRPVLAGSLVLRGPSDLAAGSVEVEIEDREGTWRPVLHDRHAAGDDAAWTLRRGPGDAAWRVRYRPDDGGPWQEHRGTARIRTGSTTELAWPPD